MDDMIDAIFKVEFRTLMPDGCDVLRSLLNVSEEGFVVDMIDI